MRKSRPPWSRVLTLVLLIPLLLGTTYKWVDRQGQVHYTDTPPPAGTDYEVVAAPHSPPAVAPGAPPAAPQSLPAVPSPPAVPEAAPAARDDGSCVDALYQLEVLAGQWRVYKPGPGDDRSYLHDRDRPAEIERYVAEDNPVRVIDVFIDELDLEALGFGGVVPEATGRPAYHPATLLKIYLYGYLNRVQSSRRLERETQRNIELMWLTGRLMPDFKTIADFRRDNGPAIRAACAQFVVLCRQFNLFTRAVVAIDGSKFKAVNNRDKNFTVAKVAKRIEQVEVSIARYLVALDRADRQDDDVAEAKTVRLKEKIEGLRGQMQSLKEMGRKVEATPDKQVSLTDPDARSMATSGKGTGIVGYNVQIAVDAEHHLIVAHEVTPIVPKCMTSNSRAEGRFDRQDFIYVAEDDEYRCPAGERAIRRFTTFEAGLTIHKYWSSACTRCPIKARCTTGDYRRITRWEHEAVLDAMQERLDRQPDSMRVRRRTVEHPFGTLKAWMGATHFLTRTLARVRTEMSLHVLAYNLKRVMQIFGIAGVLQLLSA
jgi:transposase